MAEPYPQLFEHPLSSLRRLYNWNCVIVDFSDSMQSFRPSQPFLGMDVTMEMVNQFAEMNPIMLENFNITDVSVENLLAHQQPELMGTFAYNLQSSFESNGLSSMPVVQSMPSSGNAFHESKRRKVMEQSKSSSENISSMASGSGLKEISSTKKKNNLGKGKKGRNSDKELLDKPDEVIHVRARRGQATDNHSIAERVRREKIKTRLRCLQDLVPGCYKNKGMAVMLDEIINYVHSLQNQVEFLSRELAAASSLHNFNSETEAIKNAQGTNTHEGQEMEKIVRKGYGEHSCFYPTRTI
ncbi:hypothetical protein VitviT2T_021888 [Vitis vinifera]|uniref:BHLH domain-containing protein n=2 Tax=Vitis vinifera TaxID=29760 RepID=A0ABY9D8C6_VITVI|nr:transcription factor bHLH75 isoform X1 [Vitis vinifera]WKA03799.1 hypothetical protein VitviT2T_021888 [Vitis vinifera]|eukprot:XP_010660417.1 PREDICTED: transcription factor bHLH75 isoform X1 [Vitis vinifera]